LSFERVSERRAWGGRIFSVEVTRFRHDDGRVKEREIVRHPGAVAVLAHDGERLYLVRQAREVVDEPALLELVAGRVEPPEPPLSTARRELAEEIGKGACSWRHLLSFYSVAGFSDERVHLYLATDLFDVPRVPDGGERIEVCTFPLERLEDALADCRDGKTLVGLMLLERRLARERARAPRPSGERGS
jgi:8-oxo-dGTP pyrophosphatase MutT (NUDIX family)